MFKLTNILPLAALLSGAFSTPVNIEKKSDATFELQNITYTASSVYSTPAHLAVAGGDISFNLTNPAVPYTVNCHAYGTQLWDFFYGNMVYSCSQPDGTSGSTNFTFSRPDGAFQVNQTWAGTGHHHHESTVLGVGAGKANLTCETTTWQNPNWTMGQLYSTSNTKCQPIDLSIGYDVTKQ